MSLIRQVVLLVAATLLLALVAGVGMTVDSARDLLETQLRLQNVNNANVLALALSQQRAERSAMALVATAEFDTGYYRSIRLRDAQGRPFFERDSDAVPRRAPAWFVRLLPIEPPAGVAQLSNGWQALGSVELSSQTTFAHDELWRGAVRSALALSLVGLVAAIGAAFAVGRLRRPLDRIVAQATALQQGDYRLLPMPKVPELRRATRAMNALVERLRSAFEVQSRELERLRRAATGDPATGLSNRGHFLARLGAADGGDEASAAVGGLVLFRLARLDTLNAALGRDAVDALIGRIAEVLLAYPARAGGAFSGRLNGADFGLALPERGVARESAEAVVGLLRAGLADAGAPVSIAAGAVEWPPGRPLAEVLGAADLALARAENGHGWSVEVAGADEARRAGPGERSWYARLRGALDRGDAELASFRVVDPAGRLIHLDAPLRLRLDPDAPPAVASEWLPMARRSRLTAEIDAIAVGLALVAIARDGRPRAVNLAPASLRRSTFGSSLARRLAAAPAEAARLWLEVDEIAAAEHLDALAEFGRQVRPTGVRFGLEHAGDRLAGIERLFEAGLDYVKLDAAVGLGIAADPARADVAGRLVRLLQGLGLQVYVEGVVDDADAEALIAAGVDGLTGPWAERLTGG